MRSRVAGTIVSKAYLPLARVLARSFRDHHPDIPFYVLLADRVDGWFEPDREPFEMIALDELPIPHPERFRFQHPQQPLSYASTPFFLEHLLSLGFSNAIFYKQESLVTGDQRPIFEQLAASSIVITPHLLAPLSGEGAAARELNILQSGVYNIGMLGVSGTTEGHRFLEWWMDRTYLHCRLDVPDGLHYEQRWIDLVPGYFEKAHILRDAGANVGHWNLPERGVAIGKDGFEVDGQPGRLFRFSGFEPERPFALTRHSTRLNMDNAGSAAHVFTLYLHKLEEAGYEEARGWPYAFARFDDGTLIPDIVRHIYLHLGDDIERFGDPFETGDGSFFHSLKSTDVNGISPLWEAVYRLRPDVREAFPDFLGRDSEGFREWTVASGAREHGIPEIFLPHRERRA